MQLLPLSSNPFAAPTDRDMLPSERREFVRTHRTCAKPAGCEPAFRPVMIGIAVLALAANARRRGHSVGGNVSLETLR